MSEDFQKNIQTSQVTVLSQLANATLKINTAIDNLSSRLESLENTFLESSRASSRVALSLNILTGALVIVGIAQIIVAVYK